MPPDTYTFNTWTQDDLVVTLHEDVNRLTIYDQNFHLVKREPADGDSSGERERMLEYSDDTEHDVWDVWGSDREEGFPLFEVHRIKFPTLPHASYTEASYMGVSRTCGVDDDPRKPVAEVLGETI